eukprot:jgi/Bigna1/79791/fgenesh1_pg.65_\
MDDIEKMCGTCHKAFSGQGYLDRHMNYHRRVKKQKAKLLERQRQMQRTVPAADAAASLPSSSSSSQHHQNNATAAPGNGARRNGVAAVVTGVYACDMCNKSFPGPSNLAAHMLVHFGARPFICRRCNAQFRQHGHLRYHQRVFHPNDKETAAAEILKLPHNCSVRVACGQLLNSTVEVTNHECIHGQHQAMALPNSVSEARGELTFVRLVLAMHKWSHSSQPFCPKCKFIFNQSYLRDQARSIADGDVKGVVVCPNCNNYNDAFNCVPFQKISVLGGRKKRLIFKQDENEIDE